MTVFKEIFGEGKQVEFKETIPERHEKFLKDIIAFSNTSGGKVILGVEDETGRVMGIGDQNPFKLSDNISNMIDDACAPQIYTDITPKSIEDKTVLEIEVFPGRQRPYYLKSKGKEKSTYIRINGTSRPASERKLKELELEGMRISYDMLPDIGQKYDQGATLALCDRMYKTALDSCKTQEERDEVKPLTLEKLEDFGILRKEGHTYQVTNAFTLLTEPKDYGIKIQCALFKGTGRDDFIDRKEFKGPIQDQVEMAYQFVLRHINTRAIIDGLQRRDVYELPVRSIREMIINAALHRSYLDPSPIQVSLYENRLEIDSPGMLYDGLTVEQAISGKSRCRNTAIAEAFQYMRLIEAWGTGLPRLFASCRDMGLPEPNFTEFGDGMKVIIYRKKENAIDQADVADLDGGNLAVIGGNSEENGGNVAVIGGNIAANGGNLAVNEEKPQTVDVNQDTDDLTKRIVAEMRVNPYITVTQLSEKLSASRRSIERIIKRLRDESIITRQGASHGGYWVVNEN